MLGAGGDRERRIAGVIDRVEAAFSAHRLVIVPRLAALADAVDHQVFLDQDAVAIALAVLGEHGVEAESRVTRKLPKRPQCVQAFESDLEFVRRILAEEGVLLHVDSASGRDVVILTDHPSGYAAIEGEAAIPFEEEAGLRGPESVFAASFTRAFAPDKVSLVDYDLEHPDVDQSVEAHVGDGAFERYEWPGGYTDPALGRQIAAMRLEEARGRSVLLRARSTSLRLAPGRAFSLRGAPRGELNQRWVVLELSWEGVDRVAPGAGMHDHRFVADLVAAPAEQPYRPPRPARPPTLGGVQTATTTGPGGSEIHPDALGRVKVLHRWDRRRPADDTSSHWVRPIQPALSGGFLLPRVGWEVLVGFQGASGDVPYEIGRLYNAQDPPPAGLPGRKIASHFGSRTTPGGGSENLLRTDDSAGAEDLLVNASRDYNETTVDGKQTRVTSNDTLNVGANRKHQVGIVHQLKVDAGQTTTISVNRDLSVTGAITVEAVDEIVAVGGLRYVSVGGDYASQVGGFFTRFVRAAKAEAAVEQQNRHVSGASMMVVGAGWKEAGLTAARNVGGASVLNVSGPIEIRANSYTLKSSSLTEKYASMSIHAKGGQRVEKYGAAGIIDVGGSATVKGSKVVFVADESIKLKAGGVTILIEPGKITVDGPFKSEVATIVKGDEKNT